jgi:hypothetical protein
MPCAWADFYGNRSLLEKDSAEMEDLWSSDPPGVGEVRDRWGPQTGDASKVWAGGGSTHSRP